MSKVGNESPPWQDIAVIGLACRFPGTASDEAKFMDLLAERRCQYLSKKS
jgi:acyl transferase domain-containing protein